MIQIVRELCALLEQGRTVAGAVIVRQDGSAPRGPGACLLADEHGLLSGTVGGGLAEARVLEWCREVLRAPLENFGEERSGGRNFLENISSPSPPSSKTFISGPDSPNGDTPKPQMLIRGVDMDGKLAAGADMICGGRVVVLAEAFTPADLPLFHSIRDALDSRQFGTACATASGICAGGLLAVRLTPGTGPRRLFLPADHEHPFLPSAADLPEHSVIRTLTTPEGPQDWFLEQALPPWRLILAGGGHVSRPTAHMGSLLDFEVIVLDDRDEFATAERFPDARATFTVPEFDDCFAQCPPDARTCVVILTRGHVHDATVLRQALRSPAGYIGMIGSTRKRDQVYAALRAEGVSEATLATVHCPVGLKINAQTPAEIAVSILAEIIQFRN